MKQFSKLIANIIEANNIVVPPIDDDSCGSDADCGCDYNCDWD